MTPRNGPVKVVVVTIIAIATLILVITLMAQGRQIQELNWLATQQAEQIAAVRLTEEAIASTPTAVASPTSRPAEPTATVKPTATAQPSPTATAVPTATPTPTPAPTKWPERVVVIVTVVVTPTPEPTKMATPTPTAEPTVTPSPTVAPTATAPVVPTATPAPTVTPEVFYLDIGGSNEPPITGFSAKAEVLSDAARSCNISGQPDLTLRSQKGDEPATVSLGYLQPDTAAAITICSGNGLLSDNWMATVVCGDRSVELGWKQDDPVRTSQPIETRLAMPAEAACGDQPTILELTNQGCTDCSGVWGILVEQMKNPD